MLAVRSEMIHQGKEALDTHTHDSSIANPTLKLKLLSLKLVVCEPSEPLDHEEGCPSIFHYDSPILPTNLLLILLSFTMHYFVLN